MGSSPVDYLMRRKSIFGLPLWELLCIGISFVCALIILISLWLLVSRRKARSRSRVFMHKEDPWTVKGGGGEAVMASSSSAAAAGGGGGTGDDWNPQHRGILYYPFRRESGYGGAAMDVQRDSRAEMVGKVVTSQQSSEAAAMAAVRAHNLDRADQEYRGKLVGRAKLATRAEEVRREIAASSMKASAKKKKTTSPPCVQESYGEQESEEEEAADSREEEEEKDCIAVDFCSPRANSDLGWGHRYTLSELALATNSFDELYVLGEGSHAVVYYGQLPDGTRIALRKLIDNGDRANKEFHVEVEAIGRVRHKNLVKLIGYCMEGSQRILVYEYIDNGNLEQWLHGPLGDLPPLSWDVRMKIIIGTAKGLAYLHEGLEPKVVHRDVKSSNILLDSQWNAKVSDFGLAKLMSAEHAHITTMVMGTFGYVAPEYALTGMLTEKSDVFSYGVLVMELVTGKVPVDVNRKAGEVNIVDWLRGMVSSRRLDEVADERMGTRPQSRSLKRVLLVALRCVDPDPRMRPTMGHVVHMLEVAADQIQPRRHSHRQPNIADESDSSLKDSMRSNRVNQAPRSWR